MFRRRNETKKIYYFQKLETVKRLLSKLTQKQRKHLNSKLTKQEKRFFCETPLPTEGSLMI